MAKSQGSGGSSGGGTSSGVYQSGIVKRLVSDKGFGFIRISDGTEFFFHQSACKGMEFGDLREGDPVTFQAGNGPKGPRAEIVQRDQMGT